MIKKTFAAISLAILALAPSSASARESEFERKVTIKDAKPAVMADYGGTIWWQSGPIKVDGATSLRLEFTKLGNPKKEAADIVVRDKDDHELERISLNQLTTTRSLLTRRYFGVKEVRATIEADSKPKSIAATLNAYYLGPEKDPKPLSYSVNEQPWATVAVGGATLQPDPARAVVNLLFPNGSTENAKNLPSCSGFLVGRDKIMTNHHCIVFSDEFNTSHKRCTDVLIDLDFRDQGTPVRVRCVDAKSDRGLDIAVLRIEPADIPKLQGRPILKLVRAAAFPAPATLIHHPGGLPMRLSNKCEAVARVKPGRLEHTCNSLNGSSGSPLLNAAGEVIGVQVRGYPEMTLSEYQQATIKGKKFFNLAVDAALIPAKFEEFK